MSYSQSMTVARIESEAGIFSCHCPVSPYCVPGSPEPVRHKQGGSDTVVLARISSG